MTIFISRDYLPAASGYTSNRAYWPHVYELTIFLHKILGYSIVGQTGLAINTPITTLSITAASNTAPIEITTSTAHGFSTGQSVIITGVLGNTNANGTWVIIVTGANTFTITAANGNATYTGAGTVTAGFIYAQGLVADGYGAGINFGAGVERDVSIPISKRKVVAGDIGRMLVLKSSRFPTKNSGCFKISAINVGNSTTIALASSGTTTIAAASNGVGLPTGTINVVSTTNFPTSGTIFVTTSAGIQTVTYTGKGGTTFTGCTGGTGTMSTGGTVTNTAATLPQATINVASTASFPTSGTIFITLANNGTTQVVTYTGTTGTTFTGCTGGIGIMTVGDAVANLNRYSIDYRATENPPVDLTNSVDWWLYEIENTASSSITNFATNNVLTFGSAGINNAIKAESSITTTTTIAATSNTTVLSQATTIAVTSNGVALPTGTINVASTTGFPTSGTIFVVTSGGTQLVTYTGTTGTTFTGCTGGTGTMSTGGAVTAATIHVASTSGFASSLGGIIFVTTSDGVQTVTYTNTTGGNRFNGCTGGTGIMSTGGLVANGIATLPQPIIYVSTISTFPTSGTIFVVTNTGQQLVTYTGVNLTENSFTGCTGGSGFMTTSNAVGANVFPIQVTGVTHGYANGTKVNISNVLGNTAANGNWIITVTSNSSFILNGSVPNGAAPINIGSVRIEGYTGDDVSYNSRIILQSPHPSGWQVRIAVEPTASYHPSFTVTTGYGGNSLGDFPIGGQHNHIAQFFDYNVSLTGFTQYSNLTTGGGFSSTTTSRMTMTGDDTGQAVCLYTRAVGANNGMLLFGIPDNEPVPTPTNEERVFSYGAVYNGQFSSSDWGNIRLKIDLTSNNGVSWKRGIPSLTAITGWTTLDGTNTVSPLQSTNAGDSPFISATEVLPLEIWSGVNCDISTTASTIPPFFFDQTFMGTCPFLRNGRTNFGNFVLTTEETTTRTITNATNASPIQITTSVSNNLVTGQTVTISGVLGNTAANGTWVITRVDGTNFTLNGSTGNGAWSAGGTQIANGCPRWIHLQNGIYLQWNGASGLNA